MQPIKVSVGPLAAANDAIIAASQNPTAAGDLTLTSPIVVLDKPRHVIITSASDDSAFVFTVYGTTFGGQVISENVTGANAGVASTTLDFETITRVYVNGNAGSVKVGTNDVAGSRWVRLDSWANAETSIQLDAIGTVNYTVQVTMDDPNDITNPVSPASVNWLPTNDTDAVSAIGSVFSNFQFTPTFARILLNSGSGSVVGTFAQFNVANR